MATIEERVSKLEKFALVIALAALCLALALLSTGCGGQSTAPSSCALEGNYAVTTDGCGTSFTWTGGQDWVAECGEGDECDDAVPAAWCSFVSASAPDEGCERRMTWERL